MDSRPYIPYIKHPPISEADKWSVAKALDSIALAQGPRVTALEEMVAERSGAAFAVACSSGTVALMAAVQSTFAERCTVRLPAIGFLADVNSIRIMGRRPSFTDIGETPETAGAPDLSIDIAGPVQRPIGRVHDASHSWPVRLETVSMAFSAHATKMLSLGEGGFLVTSNPVIASVSRSFIDHGRLTDGSASRHGINGRMTEMQAALGLSRIERLDDDLGERGEIADRYRANGLDPVVEPRHLFVVRTPRRAEVMEKLHEAGIGTQVHYTPALADQPNARRWAGDSLSLPYYLGMTDDEIDYVTEQYLEAHR